MNSPLTKKHKKYIFFIPIFPLNLELIDFRGKEIHCGTPDHTATSIHLSPNYNNDNLLQSYILEI